MSEIYESLQNFIDENEVRHFLMPGQLIIIDNYLTTHSRTEVMDENRLLWRLFLDEIHS